MKAVSYIALAGALAYSPASAQQAQGPTPSKDLGSLGLEELMKVQVTTASKQAENLSQVPAAVYVISAEQIRRSGATAIPELLRVVPGVQVQQISPSEWSVGIRGMGNRFSNKLLVMVDGRTVYSPTFSGVYWDAQDLDLSLIERIEVIRGPGGTLWGTNAVNGIINIITKATSKTLGNTFSVRSSTTSPYGISATHGDAIPGGAYRFDLQAFKQNSLTTLNGTDGHNDWDSLSAGFRTDWVQEGNSFSLNGRANSSHQGEELVYPTLAAPYGQLAYARYTTSEYNLIGKWERMEGAGKGTSLQMTLDHFDRGMPEVQDRRTTITADLQKPVTIARDNHMILGLGYQRSELNSISTNYLSITPARQRTQLYSAFVHDEQVLSRTTKLSLGTKLEHNDFTGWEYQPSARLTYSPSERQTFWGSVSRAVRIPATSESGTSTFLAAAPGPGGLPVKLLLVGNSDYDSEDLFASEIGWRISPTNSTFFDIATFYNRYTNLRGGATTSFTLESSPFPYGLETVQQVNGYSAVTAGAELAAHATVSDHWRLDGSYAFYTESYHLSDPSGGTLGVAAAGAYFAPRHQFTVQSQLDLPHRCELDLTGYYVGALGGANSVSPYARLDLRFGWHPSKSIEASFGITNLATTSHFEAYDTLYGQSSLARRSAFVKLDFHF